MSTLYIARSLMLALMVSNMELAFWPLVEDQSRE